MLSDDEIKREGRGAFGIDPTFDGNLMRFARTLARLLRRLADWIERPRLIYGMPPLRDIPPPPPRRVRTPLEAGYQPAPADPGAGAPNDPPRAP